MKNNHEELRKIIMKELAEHFLQCYEKGELVSLILVDSKLTSLEEDAFRKGKEEYKQFVLNILDGIDIADKELNNGCGTKAIRFALQSRLIK